MSADLSSQRASPMPSILSLHPVHVESFRVVRICGSINSRASSWSEGDFTSQNYDWGRVEASDFQITSRIGGTKIDSQLCPSLVCGSLSPKSFLSTPCSVSAPYCMLHAACAYDRAGRWTGGSRGTRRLLEAGYSSERKGVTTNTLSTKHEGLKDADLAWAHPTAAAP